MFTGDSNAAWKKYGEVDPYFGVLASDDYKGKHLQDSALDNFFRSGEAYVDAMFADIRSHVDADFSPERALDFGCGVGRLAIPMARACSHVTAIDVSPHMLLEARKNCERLGVTNAEFIASDDDLESLAGGFDLIHSFLVFQHIPPRRGTAILTRLIARLNSGGVGVVHFTYHRRAPRLRRLVHTLRKSVPLVNNLVNLAQRNPFFYPMMQMNEYDLNHLFLTLQATRCDRTFVRFTDHGGHLGIVLYFQKPSV